MTLRPLSLLLVLTALAGCSSLDLSNGAAKSAPGTPQRACEDAAEADTTLNQRAAELTPASKPGSYAALVQQLRAESVQQCLRQRGIVPPGGVERVR